MKTTNFVYQTSSSSLHRSSGRMLQKSFLAFCGFSVALAMSASAQLQVSEFESTITITFDSSISGVINGQFAGSGFQATPTAGQLDSDAWAVTGWSNGSLAFGGTQVTASTDYTRGTVTAAQSTGGIYAFGGADRKLLIQPGGSDWAPGTMSLKIQNTTGSTISSWDVAYDLYVRNDQTRANSFNFSYSTDNVSYLTTGLSDQSALFAYTSTAAAGADTGLNLIGSPMATIAASVEPNAFFYVRWSGADVGGSGSRDEFALDNISFYAIPEPSAALLGGLGVLGAFRRRRR